MLRQYVVGVCERFQTNPMQLHCSTPMKILRYVKGTVEVALWYPSESDLSLVGYSDADYDGSMLDRKSTLRTCQFLGTN